jgi:hypothetical protein
MICYLLFAYAAAAAFESALADGVRLAMAALFMCLSTVTLTGHLDPVNVPLFERPALMGLSYALIVTVNPCTIPFLAVVLSLHAKHALPSLVAFGVGLIAPTVISILLGRGVLRFFKRHAYAVHLVNMVMKASLFLAGIYIAWSVWLLSPVNVALASVGALAGAWLLARPFRVFGRPRLFWAVMGAAFVFVAVFSGLCAPRSAHDLSRHDYITSMLSPVQQRASGQQPDAQKRQPTVAAVNSTKPPMDMLPDEDDDWLTPELRKKVAERRGAFALCTKDVYS